MKQQHNNLSKTSTLDRTFLHSAITIWKALPDTVVGKIKSDSVQSFKQRVNKYMMSHFSGYSFQILLFLGSSEPFD